MNIGRYSPNSARTQKGLSLVELMVAMALSLILLAGVVQIFSSNQNAVRLTTDMSNMQENGRLAINFITESIRHADHWAGTERDQISFAGVSADAQWGHCTRDEVFDTQALQAFEGDNLGPNFCGISDAEKFYVANSDVLVVNYANGQSVIQDSAYDGSGAVTNIDSVAHTDHEDTVFVRLKVGQTGNFFTGKEFPTASASLPIGDDTRNYAYSMQAYYVRQCSILINDKCADSTPTLVRLTLQNEEVVAQPIVEGIEQVQYEMGVDTDGDLVPDTYQNISDVVNWDNVITVRMSVLARAFEADRDLQGLAESPTYAMVGGFNYQNPDREFRLRQYNREVQIRNRTR